MNEQEFTIVKEVSKELAKDVYNDGAKKSVQQAGEIVESVVGLFNNVVLYPIKKANVYFKHKLEDFKDELENRVKTIPEDKLIEPDLMIAGPTLEALKYTFDKKELKNMYLNLLTASMNVESKNNAHPGYVDIIRQLTPLDAKVFKIIYEKGQVACVHPILRIDNSVKVYVNIYPNYLVEEVLGLSDEFSLSSSLSNLIRLGLVTYEEKEIKSYNYERFKSFDILVNNKKAMDDSNLYEGNGITTTIDYNNGVIKLDDFGKKFANVCL